MKCPGCKGRISHRDCVATSDGKNVYQCSHCGESLVRAHSWPFFMVTFAVLVPIADGILTGVVEAMLHLCRRVNRFQRAEEIGVETSATVLTKAIGGGLEGADLPVPTYCETWPNRILLARRADPRFERLYSVPQLGEHTSLAESKKRPRWNGRIDSRVVP